MSSKKTPKQLLKDLDSNDVGVREAVAKHPCATPEFLLKALEDKAWEVRYAAAWNPYATPEVLMKVWRTRMLLYVRLLPGIGIPLPKSC